MVRLAVLSDGARQTHGASHWHAAADRGSNISVLNIYPVVCEDRYAWQGRPQTRFLRLQGQRGWRPRTRSSPNHERPRRVSSRTASENPGLWPNALALAWLLEFHPQIPAIVANGKAAVFLIKNISALGSLSAACFSTTARSSARMEWRRTRPSLARRPRRLLRGRPACPDPAA